MGTNHRSKTNEKNGNIFRIFVWIWAPTTATATTANATTATTATTAFK